MAYNMMRMWQGACGVAREDGIVSPAYVVLAPTDDVDSWFAYHLLKSPLMIYLLCSYSYGVTSDRLRLYYRDFAMISCCLPTKVEQTRIAAVLGAADREIVVLEKKLAALRELKKGLMQKLLSPSAVQQTETN
jgi:type I restriction enzyme S subunit